jgi:hypothetical protein
VDVVDRAEDLVVTVSLAAVILAHDDPSMVRRLIGALDGVDVFLHCDRKAPDAYVKEMTADAGPRVRLVPRRRTAWASWSLVEAELDGLAMALDRSAAEHLIVLSGSCYPLVSVPELEEELTHWRGLSRLRLVPLPHPGWNTPRNPDGGMWRFRRRFVSVRGQTMFVGGIPLRTMRRSIPRELRLHASSQWKIYARNHAKVLLRVLSERADLLRFWRTSLAPDEACAATILRSPALVGRVAEDLRDDLPWYIAWGDDLADHPVWLGERDFGALGAARWAPPRPREPNESDAATPDWYRKLFARKFSSHEVRLLDRIDRELRR